MSTITVGGSNDHLPLNEQRRIRMYATCVQTAESRGGKCLSALSEYKTSTSKLMWECKDGHRWEATRYAVVGVRHTWCPDCHILIGEQFSKTLLIKLLGAPFVKCRPLFLGGLELDGYCESLKVGMEYQGEQHYRHVPIFQPTPEMFESQLQRDALKKRLCEEAGVQLIVIPYIKYKEGGWPELTKFIRSELQRLGMNDRIHDLHNDDSYDDALIEDTLSEAFRTWDSTHAKYQKLKDLVEKMGCVLVDQLFVGNLHHEYTMICNKAGHEWKATGVSVGRRNSRRCPLCPKVVEDDIETLANHRGYEYVDGYEKCSSRMNLICPVGHRCQLSWTQFQRYTNCPTCMATTAGKFVLLAATAKLRYAIVNMPSKKSFANRAIVDVTCSNGHRQDVIGCVIMLCVSCVYCK